MDDLKNEIREYAISRGATLVGFTSVERLKEAPKGHKPEDILSDAKTVIVCANVIPKGVILYSSPTAYHNIMDILRYRIDFITYEISEFIEKLGFMAIPVTSDGPYFDWNPEKQHGRGDISHKHVAAAAGLGRLGKNSLLITQQFGNRVQLGSIVTNLNMKPDPLVMEELCPHDCMLCIDSCPVKAIGSGKMVNQKLCRSYMYQDLPNGTTIESCRICRKVCPVRM